MEPSESEKLESELGQCRIPDLSTSKTLQITEHIEILSKRIIEDNCNSKQFHDSPAVQASMAHNFRSEHDGMPNAVSLREHLDNLQVQLKSMPKFHVDIMNFSSQVEDNQGRATVYMVSDNRLDR